MRPHFACVYLVLLTGCASRVTVFTGADAGPTDGGDAAPIDAPLPLATANTVALNRWHVCMVESSGAVACWGAYVPHPSGSGLQTLSAPRRIEGLAGAIDVGVGRGHACVRTSARVGCWGFGANVQLGEPLAVSSFPSGVVDVAGAEGARSLAVADDHSCLVRAGGGAACWGFNGNGELGDGTLENRSAPTTVLHSEGAQRIALTASGGCVSSSSGSVSCWGSAVAPDPSRGAVQLDGFSDAVLVGANASQVCVLRASGVVRCTQADLWSAAPYDLSLPARATSISFGAAHACAALEDGRVACWGRNEVGQLGDGTTVSTANERDVAPVPVLVTGLAAPAASVHLGASQSCAVLRSGRVQCWGAGWHGDGTLLDHTTPVAVAALADARRVVSDPTGACALRANGAVACWGTRSGGAGSFPSSPTPSESAAFEGARYVDLCSTGANVCALSDTGAVRCTGRGLLGDGAIHSEPATVSVAGVTDGAQLACNNSNSCVLRSSGEVSCWGLNANGEAGDGSTVMRTAPVRVAGLGAAAQVGVGASHACARLRDTGDVWCWGGNSEGQLGDGSTASRLSPVLVLRGATDLVVGDSASCARTADGVSCWGANYYASLSLPMQERLTTPTRAFAGLDVTAVSVGSNHHACALLRDGTVTCQGLSYYGEAGPPRSVAGPPAAIEGLRDVVQVSAGRDHTCAVLASGAVRCFGTNINGQLGALGAGVSLTPTTVALPGP